MPVLHTRLVTRQLEVTDTEPEYETASVYLQDMVEKTRYGDGYQSGWPRAQ